MEEDFKPKFIPAIPLNPFKIALRKNNNSKSENRRRYIVFRKTIKPENERYRIRDNIN